MKIARFVMYCTASGLLGMCEKRTTRSEISKRTTCRRRRPPAPCPPTRSLVSPSRRFAFSLQHQMERAYTFDNSMAFQQPLHLDAPPFTHGKWSITFAALPRTSNTSQPSGWCRISWSGAEPAEVYRIALAVKCPGGETMEYDLLGGAARFPQFGEGELTRLLPGCAAYVEPPVLEVSSRKLQKKGKKAAFASWMDVNDSCECYLSGNLALWLTSSTLQTL